MKLALVHDWLIGIGGAERVLIQLHEMFPEAPLYVLFYDKKFAQERLPRAQIRASFLQKIPFITRIYPMFGWLMPAAIESFDLSEFDTVLSSSVTFSKGLVLKPATKHICYCYSPTRYLWDWHAESTGKFSITNLQFPKRIFSHFLRLWDRLAADRVDEYIAISKTVQARIKKYYHRDSVVIYPPAKNLQFSIPNFQSISNEPFEGLNHSLKIENLKLKINGYYLIVSRLFAHKNIDIAIEAFNKLKYPLVIIGDGPIRRKLLTKAGKNITFLGEQSDEVIASWYSRCRALIMPQEEDFGLTPIEAMSFGKPVVALRRGGACETVQEGKTGEFFDDPIPETLADAVRRLNENYANYSHDHIISHALQFSAERFKKEIYARIHQE